MPAQESEVSMIALIANLTEYQDRDVKTYGFLKIKSGVGLFVSREDALNDNIHHSIALDVVSDSHMESIKTCNNQYVSVIGAVHLENNRLTFTKPIRVKGKKQDVYSTLVCNVKII